MHTGDRKNCIYHSELEKVAQQGLCKTENDPNGCYILYWLDLATFQTKEFPEAVTRQELPHPDDSAIMALCVSFYDSRLDRSFARSLVEAAAAD